MNIEAEATIIILFLAAIGGIIVLFNKWNFLNFQKISNSYVNLSKIKRKRIEAYKKMKELELEEKKLITHKTLQNIYQKVNRAVKHKQIKKLNKGNKK